MRTQRTDQEEVRWQRLKDLRAGETPAYKNGYVPNALANSLHQEFDEKSKEELETLKKEASIAGRIMAIRSFGKAAFIRIRDRTGDLQAFVEKKTFGEERFKEFKALDVGDLVFCEGTLFKTKTNETTLNTKTLVLLTKCLRPLPEKFHGLTDIELRYRQRYLDLIMNPESKAIFRLRTQMVRLIRDFFDERDFLEVETPMMHPLVSGATARPFETHHNTLDMDLFLRIAPELYLKRLVVGGFERVYEINRNFRNEGISIQHNPEFTMLEFYQAYATYDDLMTLTEELLRGLAKKLVGGTQFPYQEESLDFGPEFERISVENALLKYSGFQDKNLRDEKSLRAYATQKKFPLTGMDSAGKLQMLIFDHEVEEKLIQPTFITQYPVAVSPLSRANDQDPFVADRFELFIAGREIANGFSELNDPEDQRERFLAQVRAKEKGDQEACDMDEDYLHALEIGLPPTAGEGIGIDRLIMLFANAASIRDVILFPLLRKREKSEESAGKEN